MKPFPNPRSYNYNDDGLVTLDELVDEYVIPDPYSYNEPIERETQRVEAILDMNKRLMDTLLNKGLLSRAEVFEVVTGQNLSNMWGEDGDQD